MKNPGVDEKIILKCTRWFKYDRDRLYVNKSQFVPVIFETPCIFERSVVDIDWIDLAQDRNRCPSIQPETQSTDAIQLLTPSFLPHSFRPR